MSLPSSTRRTQRRTIESGKGDPMATSHGTCITPRSLIRRSLVTTAAAAAALATPARLRATGQATPVAPSPDQLVAMTQQVMDDLALRATILHIKIDGDVLVTAALGESMTGVPATTDMRFRNGAVAISLMSTLMLTLVDDGVFGRGIILDLGAVRLLIGQTPLQAVLQAKPLEVVVRHAVRVR